MTDYRAHLAHIPVEAEGFELEACLTGPLVGPPVVICHPHPAFGGTMDTPLVVDLADGLAAAGFRVLRFNFRGVGGSGGRATGGRAEHTDVRAACAYLRRERADAHRAGSGTLLSPAATSDGLPALIGYSFGSLMAMKALAVGETASRYVAIGMPTGVIASDAERNTDVRTALARAPALLIAGDRDTLCDSEALERYAASVPGTRVEVLAGVDHFPDAASRARIVEAVRTFLQAR